MNDDSFADILEHLLGDERTDAPILCDVSSLVSFKAMALKELQNWKKHNAEMRTEIDSLRAFKARVDKALEPAGVE